MYRAEILADSISPCQFRLTTFEVEFPRFILAEFNTHRKLSRNSASSRAIPIHKQRMRVRTEPFVPLGFGGAQKGMVAAENLSGWKAWIARQVWLKSRYAALGSAYLLEKLGVHKSFANRLLEPWMWHTVIVTATEWENFFALRTDENAQPEIQMIAGMMQDRYRESTPEQLGVGHWHLPLVDAITAFDVDEGLLTVEDAAKISAGRCARVSYDTHMLSEDREKSLARANMLSKSGHWSPFEHQAKVGRPGDWDQDDFNGNLDGDWIQFRKTFPNESNFAKLKEAA